MSNQRLQTRANLVHDFSVWYASAIPSMAENDYDREFGEHILHVFDVYLRELERRIVDEPATQDFFALISNTRILAKMLLDEIREVNPGLSYGSSEPTTLEQMTAAGLLLEAGAQFEQSMAEFSASLETPALPCAITEFVQRVEDRLRTMQH